ncbi:MAG: AraC family transcriptional regulator [Anaerolineales bacterium]|nr:AraC family transcriptional regulator [Anaerolineales bacterium]
MHLTRKKSSRLYIFRLGRDLLVGWQTLQLFFIAQGYQLAYPVVLYPFITLLFISGPLNYMRYYLLLYPGKPIPLQVIVQMVPAALVFGLETWFYFFSSAAVPEFINGVFTAPPEYIISYLVLTGTVVYLIQYGLLLKMEFAFIGVKETREPVLISSAIVLLYMANIGLIAVGFLGVNRELLLLGILLMGIAGITYLLFENRYPDFYQLVAREERQKKYKKSLLEGLSRDKIMRRLQELMEHEKLYCHDDLKLEDLAAVLYITPHQLSEFINDQMGMNYASYISQYRVEEAKRLLENEPDKSILMIGFEVGFGSKQSFNTLFKNQTGLTPSGYRKQARAEPESQNL